MVEYLWLVPLGFVVGAFGTLIGAGGGFLLVPVLILIYPTEDRDLITSISLVVVFFNALSGSWAYGRMKRIDFKSGFIFSATAVPGAVLGAFTTSWVPRPTFDIIFSVVMLGVSAFLFMRPGASERTQPGGRERRYHRVLTDGEGITHMYSYSPATGLVLAFLVGYVSSLLGTGGGIIHVPAMIRFLNFPVHVATATSHFILAITALAGSIVHVASGVFFEGMWRMAALSVGVLVGAQFGARISQRIHGDWIVRGLAAGLAMVGIRILVKAL